MRKTAIFLSVMLITLIISSLSWTTAFAQDNVPMTCSPDQFDFDLMSAECAYAPGHVWSAEEIPYINIVGSECCTSSGDVCTTNCYSFSIGAVDGLILKTSDGITVSNTLLIEELDCHNFPLITFSRPLTPGQYILIDEEYDLGNIPSPAVNLYLTVVDETIALEQPPSESTEEPATGQVEGHVWMDLNANGIHDEGEPGAADVSVDLLSVCWGNGGVNTYRESHRKTATSDSEGFFQFTDINSEMYNDNYSYALRFSQDQAYTPQNQGDDETRDSDTIVSCEDSFYLEQDYDGYQCIIGTTDKFLVSSGETFRGMDAGILQTEFYVYMPIISNNPFSPSEVTTPKKEPTIRISDLTIYQDHMVIVTVESSHLDGLGTATVNITYDPDLLAVHSCDVDPNELFETGQCDPNFAPNALQLSIASHSGMSGNIPMAKIAFQSNRLTYNASILDIDLLSSAAIDGTALPINIVDGMVANLDCTLVSQIPQSECQALLDIYRGDPAYFEHNRGSWLDTTEPCDWNGVICQDGHVTELNLEPVITYEHVYEGPSEGGKYVARITDPLSFLSPAIGNLVYLDKLNIADGALINLPAEIGNLSNLITLDLNDNKLLHLPPEIGNLSSLTTLDLEKNRLGSLPSGIGNLSNLLALDLNDNELIRLPPEFGNLSGLTVLNLENNRLGGLPSEIGNMTNLTNIRFSGNDLRSLPTGIGNLSNLISLDLHNNSLSNLPPEIGNMTGLTDINLYNNNLSSLPPEIGNMASLVNLDLYGNDLSSLPATIGDLSTLITLDLDFNNLESLPAEISNLANLSELYLNNNNLSSLPSEIGNLSSLIELDLSRNNLSSLPSEIGNLSSLTDLGLSRNNLNSLPLEISNLSSLTGLRLSHNNLSSLPIEIGSLSSLTSLSLSGNRLTTLPNEIKQLTDTWYISLDGNLLWIRDTELSTFLTEKDPDWNSTQATPPHIYGVEFDSEDSITLYWLPPEPPIGDSDYYSYDEVGIAITDTYTVHGTADYGYYTLDGFSPGTTYSIGVRSYIPIVYSYYDEGLIERWELANEYWSDYAVVTYTVPSQPTLFENLVPFSSCQQVEWISQHECEALVAIYDSTNGPNWVDKDNWRHLREPCEWAGVTCNHTWDGTSISYAITMLDLEANGLIGTLPPEIVNLSDLESLDISRNHLSVTDSDVLTFLEEKTYSWEETQTIIPVPTGLTTTRIADNTLLISWLPVDPHPYDESNYEVSIATEVFSTTHTDILNNSYAITGMVSGTEYAIRVRTHIPESYSRRYAIWSDYTEPLSVTLPSPTDVPFYNCSAINEIQQIECEALVALYQSAGGLNWVEKSGWLETATPCSWFGVTCEGDHVIELRFDGNGLAGELPPEITDLSQLRLFDAANLPFYNCGLMDEIPQIECEALVAIYRTTDGPAWTYDTDWLEATPCRWSGVHCENGHVEGIQLTSRKLTGTIPSEIGNLSQITELEIQGNHLSSIPPEIGKLSNLEHLDLTRNQLRIIPTEISNLTNLTELDIDYNRISVTDTNTLAFLDEHDSDWSKAQLLPPTELGAFILTDQNMELVWTPLQWDNNGGHYEISIATANAAEDEFTVHGTTSNQSTKTYTVTGLIPSTSYQVRIRSYFPAWRHYYEDTWSDYSDIISVTLPASGDSPIYDCGAVNEIPQIECEALIALYHDTDGPNWHKNTGWLETTPCYWHSVECEDGHVRRLYNWYNGLVGTIPPEIGNLSSLTDINLSHNELKNIPSSIGELSQLTSLFLVDSEIESIPSEISGLSNLKSLQLDRNQLTTIPPEIVKLANLEYLSIDYNRIVVTDADLHAFLDAKSDDWADTQTVAPTAITTTVISTTTIQLTWTAIPFRQADGYYEISIAAEDGDFIVYGITISTAEESYTIAGLLPDTTYQIRLRTYTPPHQNNYFNTLWSEYSDAVTVITEGAE